MKDNKKRVSKKNLILFFAILPLFLIMISPFYVILKIAFTPEGITNSADYELILWKPSSNTPLDGWITEKCSLTTGIQNSNGNEYLDINMNFDTSGGNAKLIIPLKQNLNNFEQFTISIETSFPSYIIGFIDTYGNQTSKVIISEPNSVKNKITCINLKNFQLNKINSTNISEIYLSFNSTKSQFLRISKISLFYKLFTFANFKEVLLSASFGRYFLNSTVISLFVMLGNILFSTMAGFAFSWKSYPFRRILFISTLVMIMIPMQLFMVPMFILVQRFGWLNSYKALIIPFLISPINIFLMKQYISKIPKDFAEVALIDGASYFQIFFRIIFPMCKPAITVVAINTFVNTWNSFLYPFIFTNSVEMRTLPVGLALYIGLFDVDWSHLMAASAISALPVLILFLCFQKYIITGMLSGTAYQN